MAKKKKITHKKFAEDVNNPDVGGASRSFIDQFSPTPPGVMVSEPGAEQKSRPPLSEAQAKAYFDTHKSSSDISAYHGGWQEGGTVYQDKSKKYRSLEKARKAGKENKQIAGYDLGQTDISRPEGGNIYFDREIPGVQSDYDWTSTEVGTSEYERLAPKPNKNDRVDLAHVNRGAKRMTKNGKQVPVTLNEVLGTISKNRRKKGK